jgi:hypothetical protein
MKRFKVFSGYQQLYVMDAELYPPAPEEWTDEHVAQRHNTLRHITALCTEGDISARVVSCGPDDDYPAMPDRAEFEVRTEIEVVSGRIGVYGWPDELNDEYAVLPGIYTIVFRGYALDKVDSEEDYYGLEIRKKG